MAISLIRGPQSFYQTSYNSASGALLHHLSHHISSLEERPNHSLAMKIYLLLIPRFAALFLPVTIIVDLVIWLSLTSFIIPIQAIGCSNHFANLIATISLVFQAIWMVVTGKIPTVDRIRMFIFPNINLIKQVSAMQKFDKPGSYCLREHRLFLSQFKELSIENQCKSMCAKKGDISGLKLILQKDDYDLIFTFMRSYDAKRRIRFDSIRPILDIAENQEIDKYLAATIHGVTIALKQLKEERNPNGYIDQQHLKRIEQASKVIQENGSRDEKIAVTLSLHRFLSSQEYVFEHRKQCSGNIFAFLAKRGSFGAFEDMLSELTVQNVCCDSDVGLSLLETVLFGIYRLSDRFIVAGFQMGFRGTVSIAMGQFPCELEFNHGFEDRILLAKSILEMEINAKNCIDYDSLHERDLKDPAFIQGLRAVVKGEKSKEDVLATTDNYYLKRVLPALALVNARHNLVNWVNYVEQMIPKLTSLYDVCKRRRLEIGETLMKVVTIGEESLRKDLTQIVSSYL